VEERSRNTGTAVFDNIPRNRYNGFMALDLFQRDRDTGLFAFLQNMKNTHKGPRMATYCPGLMGSKGLNFCEYCVESFVEVNLSVVQTQQITTNTHHCLRANIAL